MFAWLVAYWEQKTTKLIMREHRVLGADPKLVVFGVPELHPQEGDEAALQQGLKARADHGY